MDYPECANSCCSYNYEHFCKAEGMEEDIICEMGKADAKKSVKKKAK
jgi:hypothetical protein